MEARFSDGTWHQLPHRPDISQALAALARGMLAAHSVDDEQAVRPRRLPEQAPIPLLPPAAGPAPLRNSGQSIIRRLASLARVPPARRAAAAPAPAALLGAGVITEDSSSEHAGITEERLSAAGEDDNAGQDSAEGVGIQLYSAGGRTSDGQRPVGFTEVRNSPQGDSHKGCNSVVCIAILLHGRAACWLKASLEACHTMQSVQATQYTPCCSNIAFAGSVCQHTQPGCACQDPSTGS